MQPGDALRSEGRIRGRPGGREELKFREAVKALESLGVVEGAVRLRSVCRPADAGTTDRESSPSFSGPARTSWCSSSKSASPSKQGWCGRWSTAPPPERLAALDEILSQWDEVSQHGTYPDELDKQFHVILAECAENGILARLSDVFWQVSSLAIADRRLVLPRDPRQTYLRHVPIYEALRTVNEASLAAALADHYGGVLDRARDVRQAADDGASR